MKTLNDLGFFLEGLKNKTNKDFVNNCNHYYIPFKNIIDGKISTNLPKVYISNNENQNKVLFNDILINFSSENYNDIGKAIISNDSRELYLNSFCKIFRSNNLVDSNYLVYLLNSPKYRNQIKLLSQGITRINLTSKKLGLLKINLHPLNYQKIIGSFINHILFFKIFSTSLLFSLL